VSGWKHSSTKISLAGVILLRRRFYKQKLFYFTSIGSGTVLLKKSGFGFPKTAFYIIIYP